MRGLYIHVPFCEARCSYCTFATWTDRSEQQASYFAALEREVAVRCEGLELDTIYFGGGTPSLPEPALLASVLRRVRAVARVTDGAEITLEANPESVTAARAAAWREAGFNRASVGVQSFDPRVLAEAGRLHGPEGPERAFRALRDAGFENLSLDLIAGLPHETAASLAESRARAVALEPDHVSLYLLELEEAGKFSPLAAALKAGRLPRVSDDEMADWYEQSREHLESRGLACYEISNFARPGWESRHNRGYWLCRPFTAAGVAAHWFDGTRRRFNLTGFEAWLAAVGERGEGEAPESAASAPVDLAQERLMLGLRLARGVDLDAIEREHPGSRARFESALGAAADAGLLVQEGASARLTIRGALLSNELFREILAA